MLTFYLLVFRNNRSWRTQRRFLISGWTLGIVLALLPPFIPLDPVAADRLPGLLVDYAIPSMVSESAIAIAVDNPIPWFYYLLRAWQYGAVVTLSCSVIILVKHLRPRLRPTTNFAGFPVIQSASISSPYAAFGRIYLPAGLSPEMENIALLHEAAHLRRGHQNEQIWLLLGRSIFWFHPLAWAYAHLLGNVHEYEADEIVARTVPPKTYCEQLLKATLAFRLVPGLFSSPLKQRIMLLTTQNMGRKIRPAHWLLLVFTMAILFLACNKEEPEFNEAAWIASVDAQQTDYPPRLSPGFSIGSMWHTLLDTIYQEVNYPAAAQAEGLNGTVLLRMDIDKSGNATYGTIPAQPRASGVVSNDVPVKIIAHVQSLTQKQLDRNQTNSPFVTEADRIAKYLSGIKWQPATKRGVAVEESLYITFSFKLEE